MLVAMAAGFLPVVSLAIFFGLIFHFLTSFAGRTLFEPERYFAFFTYREECLLSMFFSTYQIRSARCVLDFYLWATVVCF